VWRSTVGALDHRRLVFVDEMGAHTSLALLYAYSPCGNRAFFKVPRNRGKNTTLLASIGWEGIGPSMAVVGSTTKEVLETYIEHCLAPVLRPGQVMETRGPQRLSPRRETLRSHPARRLISRETVHRQRI
jgi:hypothetical protein